MLGDATAALLAETEGWQDDDDAYDLWLAAHQPQRLALFYRYRSLEGLGYQVNDRGLRLMLRQFYRLTFRKALQDAPEWAERRAYAQRVARTQARRQLMLLDAARVPTVRDTGGVYQ